MKKLTHHQVVGLLSAAVILYLYLLMLEVI